VIIPKQPESRQVQVSAHDALPVVFHLKKPVVFLRLYSNQRPPGREHKRGVTADCGWWPSHYFTVILILVVGKVLFAFLRRYALKEQESNEYHDEIALRQEVERKSRRSLSDAEWAKIAPDWSAPYGDGDVTELVNTARDSIPAQPKRSPDDNARLGRRAHAQRVALQAREMVEAFREELFGQRQPPFSNHVAQAAQWIEAQEREQEFKTLRFYVEVSLPAPQHYAECLIWLRDYLTEKLGPYSSADSNHGSDNLEQILNACEEVLRIGCNRPILDYLGVNQEGEINIKRVYAPDGTLLGKLRNKAEELSKATNWELHSALHHLLTGGLSAPYPVKIISSFRIGRHYHEDIHQMTLTISDPDCVPEQDLVTTFQKARSENLPPWRRRHRRRARVASKSERVAAFVEETPKMSWLARSEEWNRRFPNERFRTTSAMKQAYGRAILR
jgi:hypothetical protein